MIYVYSQENKEKKGQFSPGENSSVALRSLFLFMVDHTFGRGMIFYTFIKLNIKVRLTFEHTV